MIRKTPSLSTVALGRLIGRHPMVFIAMAAWLTVLGALFGSDLAVVVAGVLVLLALTLTWFWVSPRLTILTLLSLAGIFASFALQAGVNQLAVREMGAKSYFSSSEAGLTVLDEPKLQNGVYRANVKLSRLDNKAIECLKLPVWNVLVPLECEPRGVASWSVLEHAPRLAAGQQISATAFLKPTLRARAAFEAKLTEVHSTARSVGYRWLSELHQSYRQTNAGLTPDAAGLVMGLAIGDTSLISQELIESMQITGLTHLNAVSGANCAIVIGLVWMGLSRTRLNRASRTAAALVALVGYVPLVGQQPSVLRAAVMLTTVLWVKSLGRRINPLDALGLAIVILLLFDPWLAADFGFALSVTATLGLVLLSRPMTDRIADLRFFGASLPNWLSSGAGVVLSAQILSLPLILALSGYLPTYTVVANLLSEPLVAPITVLGLAAVCFCWLPPVAVGLNWLGSLPAAIIEGVAKTLAAFPMSQTPWLSGAWGILLATAICLSISWLLLSPRRRNWAWSVLSVAAAVSLSGVLIRPISAIGWPNTRWSVVACDVGQGDALVLRSQGRVAVIDVGRDPKPIQICLDRLNVHEIELLVLTHFDMDHVGGIQGVTENHRVRTIMETPWPDQRPTADFIKAAAEATDAQIVLAETGLSGSLGTFTWSVLTPSRTASEAEDSNDGSIGMLWESSEMNLLTLADLGEKGQMRIVQQNPALVAQARAHPLLLKVAHHGSADFYPELYEELRASIALISVGAGNSYGHPTKKALAALARAGTRIYRTDEAGSVAIASTPSGSLEVGVGAGG